MKHYVKLSVRIFKIEYIDFHFICFSLISKVSLIDEKRRKIGYNIIIKRRPIFIDAPKFTIREKCKCYWKTSIFPFVQTSAI